jgi:hypothetical protein
VKNATYENSIGEAQFISFCKSYWNSNSSLDYIW